jgi:hypothetical protein
MNIKNVSLACLLSLTSVTVALGGCTAATTAGTDTAAVVDTAESGLSIKGGRCGFTLCEEGTRCEERPGSAFGVDCVPTRTQEAVPVTGSACLRAICSADTTCVERAGTRLGFDCLPTAEPVAVPVSGSACLRAICSADTTCVERAGTRLGFDCVAR